MPRKKKPTKIVTEYNKKTEYEKEIEPLLIEAMKKCVVHDIPFMFSAAVANTPTKTTYAGEVWLTGSSGIVLTEDRFERHLAVMNGFETIWPAYKDTYNEAQALFSGLNGSIPESYETPMHDIGDDSSGDILPDEAFMDDLEGDDDESTDESGDES